jgi:hypothetical protein
MVLRSPIRPVLLAVAALGLSACGGAEGDPARFENLARIVSDVPVSLERPGTQTAAETSPEGLRHPAPLRVAVMDPHDLWDARDGLVTGVVEAAAPAVAEAAVQEVGRRTAQLRPVSLPRPEGAKRDIQLGAFSSRASAEAAWSKLKDVDALSGLQPRFETANVDGRDLVRLKVAAPAAAAPAICAAARVDAPWCRRGA